MSWPNSLNSSGKTETILEFLFTQKENLVVANRNSVFKKKLSPPPRSLCGDTTNYLKYKKCKQTIFFFFF